MNKKSLDPITGLKGFFCLIIVLFHTLPSTPFIAKIPLTSLIKNYGHILGNYFFFIASGFLLSFGYRDRIRGKEISFRDFLLKRLVKLYPLYLITNIAAIFSNILQYGLSAIDLKRIVFMLLMQNGGGLDRADPYNGPAWFLCALFTCYLIFYFIAYHAKHQTHYCCMLVFCIILGYSILTGHFTMPLTFAQNGDSLFCFFTGCALAEVYPLIRQTVHKWLQPAGILVLIGSAYLLLRYGVEIISGDFRVAFAFVFCPLLMYLALDCKPIAWFLQCKPVLYLGKISLSIYLWHYWVYDLFVYISSSLMPESRFEEKEFLLYFVIMLLVSILSHTFLETKKPQAHHTRIS